MAITVSAAVRSEIKAIVEDHSRGVFHLGVRDCLTLLERVLAAQDIGLDFSKVDPSLYAPTHDEMVERVVERHGSTRALFEKILDGTEGIERVDSPFEWEPGMVGITPDEGVIRLGFKAYNAEVLGSMSGVVNHETRPVAMTADRGVVAVSRLWPRWKPKFRYTGN